MKSILALVALLLATGSAFAAPAYQEPPFFADAVKKGDLPPIGERLPENPAVAEHHPNWYFGWRRNGVRNAEAHRPSIVEVAGEYDADFSTEESIWTLNHMLPRCPELVHLGIRPGVRVHVRHESDDLPIVDEIGVAQGLYVVAGSSGHGFKLGPAVGEEVVRLATTGVSKLLEPFSVSRFRAAA